jgi:formate dehydrogenase major subunit
VSMHECKAFTCQVHAGRQGQNALSPTVQAVRWPTRGPVPNTPTAAQPEGGSEHGP